MADVAGYSRLIGIDDEGTLAQLNAHHAELIEPKIKEQRGRIVRTTGDGLLVLFVSAVDALRCAVEIQRAMTERNSQIPTDRRIEFRMGVNVGDIVEGASIHGDGINVAARLEALADAGGVCVSSRVKEDAQGSLGRLAVAFEDIGQHQLKNIDHAVHIYRVLLDHAATTTVKPEQAPPPAHALPDRPSIAVLPFDNLSPHLEQGYLVDGIVEDIITELSRFSELFVIARNSSFQYKGNSPDIRHVGCALGVRYVLEGSIRRAGDRIRISAQLIDAVTGAHRWGERYDRELKDVFAIQDEVSRAIVAILVAHVNKAEAERTLLKPPAIWQAHDFFMRASDIYSRMWSSFNVADLYEARRLLERSISLDPNYARAYAALSNTHLTAWVHPLDEDCFSPAALERAHRLAWKAVQLDPNLPIAHANLGNVLTFEGQHEHSIAAFERAIALNPNYTDSRFGLTLLRAGEPARATHVIEAHLRYDPFCAPWVLGQLGLARYMLKEYSKALPPLREWTSRAPGMRQGHVWLAANLAQLGQLDEARAEAAEVLRIDPKYTIDGTQRRISLYKRPDDVE